MIDTVGTGEGQYKDLNESMGPMIFKSIDVIITGRIVAEQAGVMVP